MQLRNGNFEFKENKMVLQVLDYEMKKENQDIWLIFRLHKDISLNLICESHNSMVFSDMQILNDSLTLQMEWKETLNRT